MNTGKRASAFWLLLSLLVALSGCMSVSSPQRPAYAPSEQVSPSSEAQAMYNYLKYLELKKADNQDQALRALQNATGLAPSPELYIEQGRQYMSLNKPKLAQETVKSGLQEFPGHGGLVRYLARLYMEQDKLENATSLLSVYLRKHGGDPETVAELAQVYIREERSTKSRELLQSVPAERRTPQIHYLLGRTRLQTDQPGGAVPHFRSAVEAKPEYLQAWAQLGYALERQGDFAGAQKAYSRLVDQGRKSDELLLKLVSLDLKLNNPDRAMEYVQEDPSGPDFLFRACSLFLRAEFYSRAESILEMLPQSARENGKSLYYRAIIVLRRDQAPQKALDNLERVPSSSTMHQDALLLRGRVLLNNQRPDKALEAARQGRRDYSESSSFWSLESRILLQLDKPGRAREVLRQGLDEVSNPAELWSQLAIAEHELGNSEEALRHMRRLLEKDPENTAALNFIGYTLVEQERDLDKAGRLIRRALKLDPGNPYYLDSLAWYLFKTNSLEKAWETIQKAISRVQDDPTLWEHYGEIATNLDKRDEARKGYKKALELDPDDPEALRNKLESLPQ
ncbi:MAG: tetratricopeptide repeat protein [Desulfohalobiaceae bacterium]